MRGTEIIQEPRAEAKATGCYPVEHLWMMEHGEGEEGREVNTFLRISCHLYLLHYGSGKFFYQLLLVFAKITSFVLLVLKRRQAFIMLLLVLYRRSQNGA